MYSQTKYPRSLKKNKLKHERLPNTKSDSLPCPYSSPPTSGFEGESRLEFKDVARKSTQAQQNIVTGKYVKICVKGFAVDTNRHVLDAGVHLIDFLAEGEPAWDGRVNCFSFEAKFPGHRYRQQVEISAAVDQNIAENVTRNFDRSCVMTDAELGLNFWEPEA